MQAHAMQTLWQLVARMTPLAAETFGPSVVWGNVCGIILQMARACMGTVPNCLSLLDQIQIYSKLIGLMPAQMDWCWAQENSGSPDAPIQLECTVKLERVQRP